MVSLSEVRLPPHVKVKQVHAVRPAAPLRIIVLEQGAAEVEVRLEAVEHGTTSLHCQVDIAMHGYLGEGKGGRVGGGWRGGREEEKRLRMASGE